MFVRMFAGILLTLIHGAAVADLLAQDVTGSPIEEALRPGWFPILPWDQMRALDEPKDHSHGLASLAECRFTLAGFVRIEDLSACERLGLRAIVQPDSSLGLTQGRQLSDEQIDEAVRTLAAQTKGRTACVGYYIRDEPAASDFAYLGKIVAAIRRHAPGQIAYINLFPSYATTGAPGQSQLETDSYAEYLERYVAEVKPQFLSYDNYMVQYSKDLRDRGLGAIYFRDLLEVRRVALKHELPFWNIVSCSQIQPDATPPSPANLLLQAWTTLAAGGHGVSWYKYEQLGYEYDPIDDELGRTATWSYLQMVNGQLKVIGPIVSGLRSVGVYFTQPAPLDNAPALPDRLVQKLDADGPLMLGEFASHDESVDHVVLVNLSLERTINVQLKDLMRAGDLEACSPEDGHFAKCKPELKLAAGQGVLLKLKR